MKSNVLSMVLPQVREGTAALGGARAAGQLREGGSAWSGADQRQPAAGGDSGGVGQGTAPAQPPQLAAGGTPEQHGESLGPAHHRRAARTRRQPAAGDVEQRQHAAGQRGSDHKGGHHVRGDEDRGGGQQLDVGAAHPAEAPERVSNDEHDQAAAQAPGQVALQQAQCDADAEQCDGDAVGHGAEAQIVQGGEGQQNGAGEKQQRDGGGVCHGKAPDRNWPAVEGRAICANSMLESWRASLPRPIAGPGQVDRLKREDETRLENRPGFGRDQIEEPTPLNRVERVLPNFWKMVTSTRPRMLAMMPYSRAVTALRSALNVRARTMSLSIVVVSILAERTGARVVGSQSRPFFDRNALYLLASYFRNASITNCQSQNRVQVGKSCLFCETRL